MAELIPMKAVIFDYGEVLCRRADEETLERMAAVSGINSSDFFPLYWKFRLPYDRGSIDASAYWRQVAEGGAGKFSDEQIRRLISHDIECWSAINPLVLAWAERVRAAGIKTAVLSNMPPDLAEHMQTNFAWLKQFTHQTFSSALGSVKPEPEIYRHCLEGLGVEAEAALLIDDREENVAGARALGMHGIVFRSIMQLRAEIADQYDLPLPQVPAEAATGSRHTSDAQVDTNERGTS